MTAAEPLSFPENNIGYIANAKIQAALAGQSMPPELTRLTDELNTCITEAVSIIEELAAEQADTDPWNDDERNESLNRDVREFLCWVINDLDDAVIEESVDFLAEASLIPDHSFGDDIRQDRQVMFHAIFRDEIDSDEIAWTLVMSFADYVVREVENAKGAQA